MNCPTPSAPESDCKECPYSRTNSCGATICYIHEIDDIEIPGKYDDEKE